MADASKDQGLGKRIKAFRAHKHLTQADLARAARVSPAYVSELEGGAGKRPSGRVLLGLADALGVTIADLLGRQVQPATVDALPEGLQEFAAERGLPHADIEMLASIRFRGDPPRSARRWALIYDTIWTSRGLDDEPSGPQA